MQNTATITTAQTFEGYFNQNRKQVYVRISGERMGVPTAKNDLVNLFTFDSLKALAQTPYTWLNLNLKEITPAVIKSGKTHTIRNSGAMLEAVALNHTAPTTTATGEGRQMADELHAQIMATPDYLNLKGQIKEVAPQTEPAPALVVSSPVTIADGFYTVQRADGTHITFKIATQSADAGFAPGSRIISTLIGQDNESDYKGFAFLFPSGQVKVWGKMAAKVGDWAELATALISGDWKAAGVKWASQSGKCFICNRKLTTPDSVQAGIGPICADKISF